MESVVISTENIRPSSPTPLHLRNYKFSLQDQLAPPYAVPIVLYYLPNIIDDDQSVINSDHTTKDDLLKRSLSLTLTRFYPLAGRITKDGLSIDCNDQGVTFSVVKFTGCRLSDVLKNPDPHFPKRLLSDHEVHYLDELGPNGNLAMVQVNNFDCGGIAIGVYFRHKIADAVTIGYFLNAWATTARVAREPVCPNYIFQSLFPQNEEMATTLNSRIPLKFGKSRMHRYVFDASAILQLKAKLAGVEQYPTRVGVVTAFIWKCFMVASLSNGKKVSMVSQPVNMRTRAQPPFPADCFGNFVSTALASSTNEEGKEILGDLVKKLRNSINEIFNHDYFNRMLGDEGMSFYIENLQSESCKINNADDVLFVLSWCGIGMYNIDFGWGKPLWVTKSDKANDSYSDPYINYVGLMDTRSGDGVEAWVILDEEYMQHFDNIQDLKTYASKDPSPLG